MMIFRTGDIIMVIIMLCAAFWTYEVKSEALRRTQDARRLERQIAMEEDSAAVLRARWALATEPERLKRLADRYHDELGLEIIQPRQIVKAEDIPAKLPDPVQMAIKDNYGLIAPKADAAAAAQAGLDNIATGSVNKAAKVKALPADNYAGTAETEAAASLAKAKAELAKITAASGGQKADAAPAEAAKPVQEKPAARKAKAKARRRKVRLAPAGGGLY